MVRTELHGPRGVDDKIGHPLDDALAHARDVADGNRPHNVLLQCETSTESLTRCCARHSMRSGNSVTKRECQDPRNPPLRLYKYPCITAPVTAGSVLLLNQKN